MPELSEDAFKELLALYVRAHRTPGVSIEEGRRLRLELIEKLTAIYSADPLPFPYTFEDFRRTVIDRMLETLRKEDPRFRRPRF